MEEMAIEIHSGIIQPGEQSKLTWNMNNLDMCKRKEKKN